MIPLKDENPTARFAWLTALSLAMLISTAVMVSAQRISAWVGRRGIIAMERLMGLVLTAIAVQMLLAGVQRFVVQLPR